MKAFVLCLAAALVTVAGCVAVPETTGSLSTSEGAELDKRANAWRSCLGRSYRVQLGLTRDRDMAAEHAFQACATEERAALDFTIARSGLTNPAQVNQLVADGKAAMKAGLVASR
jgi:hypothetical protein